MTCDERLEKLLNRAGQTISDLPKGNRKEGAYPGQKVSAMQTVCQFDRMLDVSDVGILNCLDYILHLTDVIDRLEWALENLLNLKDRHVHIVSNVDAPEGLTQEQYFTAAEAIIDATDKYRAGLEPWDDWRADDGAESDT